jgi:propanol-preferring alcohol dehydrogenase
MITEFGKVNILDIPKPKVTNDRALVKITSAGVCHSDLHLAFGDWAAEGAQFPLPFPLGHEGIGIVEELGPGADKFIQKGDRVILGLGGTGGHWCGTCEYCISGKMNYCVERQPLFGIFSEYISIWAPTLVKIPEELDDKEVPLACGGLTAYGAIKKLRSLGILEGKNVAIIGAGGGLGHYAIQIAKNFRYNVIGVDIGQEKLELIKKLGADHAIDASEAVKYVTKEFNGLDACVVFAASIPAYNLGIQLLKVGGTLVGAGMPAFSEGSITLAPFQLVMNDLHIVGSLTGTVEDMKELVQLAVDGKVKTHVGRTAKLSELNEVFAEMKEGKIIGRAVINNLME